MVQPRLLSGHLLLEGTFLFVNKAFFWGLLVDNSAQEDRLIIEEVWTYYAKIRKKATFSYWTTNFLNLYQRLFN